MDNITPLKFIALVLMLMAVILFVLLTYLVWDSMKATRAEQRKFDYIASAIIFIAIVIILWAVDVILS